LRIKVLPDHEARRLAAGEVIERPAAAVRELLDNALDAGASSIVVHIYDGGLTAVSVRDNGIGMDADDMQMCLLPHATSKISSVDDLSTSYSLGFRGEALASLAACSQVQIMSKVAQSEYGYMLHVIHGHMQGIVPQAMENGTHITVKSLFYNLPARKRFLKGASAENRECRQIFYERALAFPELTFQYFHNDELKHHLYPSTLVGRVQQLFGHVIGEQPLEVITPYQREGDGFALHIIASQPHVYRTDKRYIHIYVNGRRIIEYSLVQAILYAYDAILPGGQFPVAFIFLQVRADLLDFNIHPAKREAKLQNLATIHKAVVQALQPYLQPKAVMSGTIAFKPTDDVMQLDGERVVFKKSGVEVPLSVGLPLALVPVSEEKTLPKAQPQWYYIGQVMGVFLLVEKGESLYLIDQHAAHERMLYNELCATPPTSQMLLEPIVLEVGHSEQMEILGMQYIFAEVGVRIEPMGEHEIHITAAPPLMNAGFWQQFLQDLGPDVRKHLFATMACRAAIKEGEYVDDVTGKKLVHSVFAMDEPFCPHGRPLWIELERQQLYKWIKRLV
jgi:DNA mismatch repair protein MutL